MSYARDESLPVEPSNTAQQTEAVEDRRKHERKPSDVDIDLLIMGDDLSPIAEVHGFARNISKGGMNLITAGSIPKDSDLLMIFRSTRQGAPPVLFAKVRNCTEQESGWYSVGVQFMGMPAALSSPEWMHQAASKLFKVA